MTVTAPVSTPRTTEAADSLRTLVVAERRALADGVVALTLRAADREPLPSWSPGSHIDLLLPGELAGRGEAIRQYSLCGSPSDRQAWRIAVLREEAGRGGSRWVHDHLQPGTTVSARGPRNHFPVVEADRFIFIAGGIGITPLLPMLEHVSSESVEWELFYGGRRRSSMAFLDELARYGPHVHVRPEDETGLLDLRTILADARPGTAVYCCGPAPLLAAVEEQCTAWPDGSLHTERFAPDAPADTTGDTAFDVVLAQSGQTVTVPAGRSILSALEETGVPVLSSCQEGTCGTCETGVLEGDIDHRDYVLSEADRRRGDCMMICVSRAKSERLVLDL